MAWTLWSVIRARCAHDWTASTGDWHMQHSATEHCIQVYLIEVNSCPALALQGKVLERLLPQVIEEVVQKAVDPLFPGSAPAQQEMLQGFKPLQIQTTRARPLMRVFSTPAPHHSTLPCLGGCPGPGPMRKPPHSVIPICICAGSPSPYRKLVKTNSAPVQVLQRSRCGSHNIASKG